VPGKPSLALLSFKNVPAVWFRVVSADPEDIVKKTTNMKQEDVLKYYLGLPVVKNWQLTLPSDVTARSTTRRSASRNFRLVIIFFFVLQIMILPKQAVLLPIRHSGQRRSAIFPSGRIRVVMIFIFLTGKPGCH